MNKINEILKRIRIFLFRGKTENWKIIALCFLGATIFWFFNALNKEYSTRIRYPVEFIFDHDSVVVVKDLPGEVRLSVSGGGWNLLRKTFWFSITPAEIELENPTTLDFITGAYLETIIAEQVGEIVVNDVLTDTIPVQIEKKIIVEKPIKIDSSSIHLEDNLRIISPIFTEPDIVTLTGPVSQLNAMNDTVIIPLYNFNVEDNFNEEIDLTPLLPSKVNVDPKAINVRFQVKAYTRIDKEVEIEPVNFPEENWYLKDSSTTISFELPVDQLNILNKSEFRVLADFNNINWNDSTIMPLVANAPDYVSGIKVDSTEFVEIQYAEEQP